MSESAVNVFISWIEHRAMVIWWRDAFEFEFSADSEAKR